MTLDVALTAGEIAALLGPSSSLGYLVYDTDNSVNVVATARINQTEFSYPITQLTVDGTSASWANIVQGQIIFVGTTAGGFEKGIYQVRKAGSASTIEITPVGEGDGGEITATIRTDSFADDDYLTVLQRYDIFGLNPRIDYPGTGVAATIYENWDKAYTNENRYSYPIVNLIIDDWPGNYAKHVRAATSYTFDIALQIYLWATSTSATFTITLPSGMTLNSGSLTGTQAGGTINVTANHSADPYTIKVLVTENNGNAITCYRKIWIKSNLYPPLQIAKVDSENYAREFSQMTLTLEGQTFADIPPHAMLHYFEDAQWNGTTVASAITSFTGYIRTRQDTLAAGLCQTTLEVVGPCGIMQLIGANSQRYEVSSNPTTWQQIHTDLTYIDFVIWTFFRSRMFGILQMFNYTALNISNTSGQMTDWRVDGGTLYGQVQQLATRWKDANIGSDVSGEIFVRPHPSVIAYENRDAQVATRCILDEGIYASVDFGIEERPRLRRLRGEAFWSDAITVNPVWCDAPGSVPGQGASEEKLERMVVDSPAEIYQITGDEYAKRNNRYTQITITIKKNWNVVKPAQMLRMLLRVPAWLHPTGIAWSGYVLPMAVQRRRNNDNTIDTVLVCEAETAGTPAVDVPIPIPNPTIYRNFSRTPIKPPPSGGYGKPTTGVPISGVGAGGLWATQDGYVMRGGVASPVNISPTAAQRASIGTAIKMIADPYNYRRLFLYGSISTVACDDHTTTSPKWRSINLTGQASTGGWSQPFDFVASQAGWDANQVRLGDGNIYSHYAIGSGFVADCITTPGVPTMIALTSRIIPAGGSVDSVSLTYSATLGNNPTGQIIFWYNNDTQADTFSFTLANGTHTVTQANTNSRLVTSISYIIRAHQNGACGATAASILSNTLYGSGANPFGGGGGSGEVFITDFQGSINRQNYFCWLTKRTVSGTDYVYFNFTADSFRTRKSVQVAKWQSDLYYTIQLRSYNGGSSGTIFISAGTTSDTTAKVYKSTNWGATWAATAVTLNTRGGVLNVPYKKAGGTANSAATPQYAVIKGLSGGNLQLVNLAGSTVTVVATASYPQHPFALHSYTLDGNYLSVILASRAVHVSSDAGGTWAAATTPTGGTSATGIGLTGWPTNRQFLFAWGYRLLAYSADYGAAWTSFWAAYDTWRGTNLGSGNGETIISAFADLSQQYPKAVTQ